MTEFEEFAEALLDQISVEINEEKEISELFSKINDDPDIPKNFQSRVVVEDETETRSVDIFMNNPLRKGGQTFYQFQMNQNQLGATVQTVLQVVKNPNWITAYIGCVIVSVGLLYQFIYHLVGFSRKRRSMEKK